jgi:predicted kinase
MKLTLFLLLGYPGAGKSTLSKQLVKHYGFVWVNTDEIRPYMYDNTEDIRNPQNNPAVFGAIDYATEKLLSAGLSVLYDANNNKLFYRVAVERLAAKYDAETVIIWVRTPLESSRERNDNRAPDAGYGRIPEERYNQLVRNLQEPTADEHVIEIDGLSEPDEQVRSFGEAARRLGII